MFGAIKRLFGSGPKKSYKEMVQEGAIVVDVRSKGEFSSGHIRKSINIPLEQIDRELSRKLKDKDKTIILCCASGARSGMARRRLKAKGYPSVYNGGGWTSLRAKL